MADYRDQAILLLEEGHRYGYYIKAPGGWPVGYLVYTKAGYRKHRRMEHVRREEQADWLVRQFMAKQEQQDINLLYAAALSQEYGHKAFVDDLSEY